ncbi:hypothetical protein GCM10008955_39840 [Deinococcus malanensis]|uniref:Uncharacterized protein n=1 Tax=Deinococcus malanensis TaxID=1706855 RepID=A0ABQ2F4V9_9DEIO|nr:hypothetical protein GCM10008955_39840 [Deinococcus malanensis]
MRGESTLRTSGVSRALQADGCELTPLLLSPHQHTPRQSARRISELASHQPVRTLALPLHVPGLALSASPPVSGKSSFLSPAAQVTVERKDAVGARINRECAS